VLGVSVSSQFGLVTPGEQVIVSGRLREVALNGYQVWELIIATYQLVPGCFRKKKLNRFDS